MTKTLFIGRTVIHLDRIDSTNNYARQLVRDKMPIEGTVVVAQVQTAGRGQRANTWLSQPGSNLTCSYILQPAFLAAPQQFLLGAAVALAVFDTVLKFVPKKAVHIKWPNDVLVEEKKIAGILIENSLRGNQIDHSVVGIGLNVNQTNFAPELNATSLSLVANTSLTCKEVLAELNVHLEKHYLRLRQGNMQAILNMFNQHLLGFKQQRLLTINNVDERVTIMGARPSGELQLQRANGSNTVHQHHEIGWNLA